ncbi:MAG: WYL domain-containing protein [Dehalococcoidales bacterium]|nr:WYL domain-containing protein [Dehalococcoidales bacterium]
MTRDESIARAIRLTRIQHLLHSHPGGLTTRELAELCGVCMRTIQRDLHALGNELQIPLTQTGDYYGIIEGYILPPVSLSLYEALAVFISLRLCLRQTDKNNPHIEKALGKISSTLPEALRSQVEKSLEYIHQKPATPEYTQIFEKVALAWTTRRRMKITYQSLQSEEVREWLLEPYFVETTGVGYSIYVIGHAVREGKEGLITFKLDRIKTAEVLESNFEIPADFDIGKLLSGSWGIIWGEEQEVELKFSPAVTRRVKEANWHASQIIKDLPDGGCILRLKVGSLLEITPWIRSWGPDVEVLAPESLRQEFRLWTSQLNRMYNAGT